MPCLGRRSINPSFSAFTHDKLFSGVCAGLWSASPECSNLLSIRAMISLCAYKLLEYFVFTQSICSKNRRKHVIT